MEGKAATTSAQLLKSIANLIESGGQIDSTESLVLSCGGLFLKKQKLPEILRAWESHIFLPNSDNRKIRIFRLNKESSRRCLRRALKLGYLN